MKKLLIIALLALSLTSCKQPTLVGDVNLDGKVTVEDMTMIQSHIKGIATLTGDELKAADVNKDGTINIFDMVKVNQIIKGI